MPSSPGESVSILDKNPDANSTQLSSIMEGSIGNSLVNMKISIYPRALAMWHTHTMASRKQDKQITILNHESPPALLTSD